MADHDGPTGRHRRRRGQRGETLLESVVTLAVLAAVIPAGLAGLQVSLQAGERHDASARTEALVRSAAEWLQSPDTAYVARAGCSGAGSYSLPAPGGEQPEYAVAVDRVQFWSDPPPSTTTPLPTAATVSFQSSCPSTDPGLQRITVTATGRGASTSITVVKRTP